MKIGILGSGYKNKRSKKSKRYSPLFSPISVDAIDKISIPIVARTRDLVW